MMKFIPNYLEDITILDACIRSTMALFIGIFLGMVILWSIEERYEKCSKFERRLVYMVDWVHEKFKFIL